MLNIEQLKKAEEELKSRSGGSGMFVRLGQDETKDIRILDPTPSMNELYYIEVPIWWINGKPITSPEFLDASDKPVDLIQDIMDQFETEFGETEEGAAEFKKLRNAEKGKGMKLIQKTTGFWVPILEFDWKIANNEIVGIENDKGEVDPVKIKKFINGGGPKILDAKMSLLKSINRQLTTGRGGATFLDQDKGFNMIVSRAGTGRDTTYTAQKEDQMPMPAEFYGADALDPVEVAKSTIFTDAYIEAVLANYFFGEAIPKNAEYRFPELREKLKDGDSADSAPTTRRRRATAQTEEAPTETAEEPTEAPAEKAPTRRRSAAKAEAAPRQRRSLLKDTAASE